MNSLDFEFQPKPISLRVLSKEILELALWLLSEARTALKATGSMTRPAPDMTVGKTPDADELSIGIAEMAGNITKRVSTNKRNLMRILKKKTQIIIKCIDNNR